MLNVCSACTFRHGYENINVLRDCCLTTCNEFNHPNCEEICTDCMNKTSKKCVGSKKDCTLEHDRKEPFQRQNTSFADCLVQNDNNAKESIKCCLRECKNDFECQEKCIDAYNATLPVVETFTVSTSKTEHSYLLMLALLSTDIALFTGIIRKRLAFFVFILTKAIMLLFFFRLLKFE